MSENVGIENNIPINPSGWEILRKLIIGLFVGFVFAALVFLMFIGLGGIISEAIKNSASNLSFSPIVWLSFLGIGIFISILGNIVIAGIYNILWSDEYYDMKLMAFSTLTVNLLMIIPFIFLYFYIGGINQNIDNLFLLFGFHLLFNIFVSLTVIDFVKNPSYSPVYMIGNTFGFIFVLLLFFVLFSLSMVQTGETKKNILLFIPVLGFSIIPFISTLWEKLYYKFYELGNDFLYIPSVSEVLVDEEEQDEVNVEIKK